MTNSIIKLLFVEDSRVQQMAFEKFVTSNKLPYNYDLAKSVEQVKSILEQKQFDVIVSDYLLEDGSAFDLFTFVHDTPIIIVTGLGDQETAVKAMKMGAYDYMIKDRSSNHLKTLPVTVENAILHKKNENELIQYREHLEELVEKRTIELKDEIVERKRTEKKLKQAIQELERSHKELKQFVHVASHDLQEPLRLVASFTQMLARRYKGKLDAEADDFIAFAVNGATRIKEIFHDFLAYSQVGLNGITVQSVNCNEILKQTIYEMKNCIDENHVTVEYDAMPTIFVDKIQIKQVFHHLIDNAIKFRSEQSPKVEIRAQQKDHEWLFSVHDNGIGIDSQYSKHIFLLFKRLWNSDQYSGTGIGLAVCQKVINRHGGKIWVKSEKNKGSVFYFTIPIRQ